MPEGYYYIPPLFLQNFPLNDSDQSLNGASRTCSALPAKTPFQYSNLPFPLKASRRVEGEMLPLKFLITVDFPSHQIPGEETNQSAGTPYDVKDAPYVRQTVDQ